MTDRERRELLRRLRRACLEYLELASPGEHPHGDVEWAMREVEAAEKVGIGILRGAVLARESALERRRKRKGIGTGYGPCARTDAHATHLWAGGRCPGCAAGGKMITLGGL
jgi:hypothetical protein